MDDGSQRMGVDLDNALAETSAEQLIVINELSQMNTADHHILCAYLIRGKDTMRRAGRTSPSYSGNGTMQNVGVSYWTGPDISGLWTFYHNRYVFLVDSFVRSSREFHPTVVLPLR